MLYNFHVVNHVMVRPEIIKKDKLSTGWIWSMCIMEAKSDLIFEVDDWFKSEKN